MVSWIVHADGLSDVDCLLAPQVMLELNEQQLEKVLRQFAMIREVRSVTLCVPIPTLSTHMITVILQELTKPHK